VGGGAGGKAVRYVVAPRDGKRDIVLTDELEPTPGKPGVPDLGLSVQSLNADLAKQFGHKQQEGLIISEVNEDGPAAAGSLRVGDLITEINREKVTTIKEFRDVLAKAKGRDSVLLLIQRAGASRFVILRLKTDK
jgi:serine protease Do